MMRGFCREELSSCRFGLFFLLFFAKSGIVYSDDYMHTGGVFYGKIYKRML